MYIYISAVLTLRVSLERECVFAGWRFSMLLCLYDLATGICHTEDKVYLWVCICVSTRKVIIYPLLFYCLQIFSSISLWPLLAVTDTKPDSIPSCLSRQIQHIKLNKLFNSKVAGFTFWGEWCKASIKLHFIFLYFVVAHWHFTLKFHPSKQKNIFSTHAHTPTHMLAVTPADEKHINLLTSTPPPVIDQQHSINLIN